MGIIATSFTILSVRDVYKNNSLIDDTSLLKIDKNTLEITFT